MLPLVEDQRQTDRVAMNATDCSGLLTLILRLTLTVTYDRDF